MQRHVFCGESAVVEAVAFLARHTQPLQPAVQAQGHALPTVQQVFIGQGFIDKHELEVAAMSWSRREDYWAVFKWRYCG